MRKSRVYTKKEHYNVIACVTYNVKKNQYLNFGFRKIGCLIGMCKFNVYVRCI